MRLRGCVAFALLFLLVFPLALQAELQVGAASVDITPQSFPVLINGGFYSRQGEPKDIHARAIVMDDGETRIAIVVTDSCMLPKDLVDSAKQLAAQRAKIRPDHMLISATHTHTAPSSMGALGTDADPTYVPYLRIKLAEAILEAEKNLQPAQVGWGSTDANEFTALRRWILRPGQEREDPFGEKTVRASMHTAKNNLENVTGESGPEDPELSVISFQSLEGEPIALLANFSMHYFSGGGAADYFGAYCEKLEEALGNNGKDGPNFVAVMSHGCSGDIWRVDYRTGTNQTFDGFVDGMVAKTQYALEGIEYQRDAPLAMAETRMRLNYRVPSAERLEWAKGIVAEMGDRGPKTPAEVYAREQIILDERQSTEIVLQALRIGSIAIATTPNETYALTGLKLKRRSPLPQTMVIELANGGDGYIPPPEQHILGGYNTWAARSAGLETTAEPKIVEADLELLEKVVGKARRESLPPDSKMAASIRMLKPIRYFPLHDMEGPTARDFSPNAKPASIEDGVVFFLEGADGPALATDSELNRAAHFANGRIIADIPEIGDSFTISQWIWNGLDLKARPIAGWFLSHGVTLGIAGQGDHAGKLILETSDSKFSYGKTPIERWTWANVVLVRSGETLRVYLNGKLEIESQAGSVSGSDQVYIGGHANNTSNWEGRLDEVAIFDRTLSPEEISTLADDGRATPSDTTAKLSEEDKTKGGRHWVDEATPLPKSAAEQLKTFQVEPGFRLELVAAEPLVMDPVAVAFDAQGRMFVAEYGDYPIGPSEEGAPPLSRIVLLEDTNDDGQMDKRTVFADKLNFCHSLMPLQGGILACAQTELILLKDQNGDNVADSREVLFRGFQPAHPQMQVGCPRWGLDNRIYFNYGVGKILGPGQQEPTTIGRTEFWINPLTYEFGSASGTGQYGNTFTAWGDRLFSTNRNPIIATTMSTEEAARNRYAPLHRVQYDVAPSGGDSKVFPLVAMKSNWLSHAGTHTSACGTTAYVGDGLGPAMENSVLACEPIGHLVTRAIVKRDGAKLSSQRAREDADFIASTDTWFRPASLANGPDGMLYLADMYRLWVEHPKFLPPEIAAQLDWRAGDDRGRIWRIVPDNTASQASYKLPKTTTGLVQMLEDANGWRRRTAQQLLVEEQDTDATDALIALASSSKSPLARLHALWTLEGLNQLDDGTIGKALHDEHSEVRAAAIRLASRHWDERPETLKSVFTMTDDPSPWVRYQLALAMGLTSDPRKVDVLSALISHDGKDPTFADAIVAASQECAASVLANSNSKNASDLSYRLAKIVGAKSNEVETETTFKVALQQDDSHHQIAVLRGLADGMAQGKRFEAIVSRVPNGKHDLTQKLLDWAQAENQSPQMRSDAIGLLRFSSLAEDEFFANLCSSREPPLVQQAAVTALAGSLTSARETLLADLWPELEPSTKQTALSLLLKTTRGVEFILTGLQKGTVSTTSLSLDQQSLLQKHRDDSIRKRAEQLLGRVASSDRTAVLQKYESATRTIGSPLAGREVFLKQCAKCHVPGEAGQTSVGPDLADSSNRPPEAILFDILNPSGKVEPKYAASQILTVDGQTYSGIVMYQSPQAILLQLADGKTQEIPRSEIELFHTSDQSLMPEGLEKEISLEHMANLLEFLKSPLPKK
ncbi:Neutral/alkaline non-lysosomal ceramidase [Bremerella volcania]|uniref:Neutral/alkaline non-lysosomal ceramidase n=1 Tax=Bremerella volcania TaxID=2527984 RepID=A0A518CB19_9BACT|nr:PVC-type heme-binding CxxCH protein [Bremerella volcania]QDU76384.1 Neutral/alkaline non-lysosomal ceramidase [Bremerella volcania]